MIYYFHREHDLVQWEHPEAAIWNPHGPPSYGTGYFLVHSDHSNLAAATRNLAAGNHHLAAGTAHFAAGNRLAAERHLHSLQSQVNWLWHQEHQE